MEWTATYSPRTDMNRKCKYRSKCIKQYSKILKQQRGYKRRIKICSYKASAVVDLDMISYVLHHVNKRMVTNLQVSFQPVHLNLRLPITLRFIWENAIYLYVVKFLNLEQLTKNLEGADCNNQCLLSKNDQYAITSRTLQCRKKNMKCNLIRLNIRTILIMKGEEGTYIPMSN